MGARSPSTSILLPCLIVLFLLARPSYAFGAGNIASTARVEGQNWRHGDIEDTLLTILISRAAGGKKFSKMDVKRTYFGNWLRDYSQAIDVGTVKMVSAEAIRILLWILGFLSFGYGTKEFEVTAERLGCYRPEDHIDNPKDYADNLDAREYDPRLRGPVDERRELAIDPNTGLKNYIANERIGITTSAGHVRNLFGRSVDLGRRFARNKDKADLYEALRLLGTGLHCLEDYGAHSNYTELALIELGERNVFPHVGRQTTLTIPGAQHPVYPIITGTFGGVDFLHSVMGELSDKTTQSELQELEGTMTESENSGENTSMISSLLSQLPAGLVGGDQSGKVDQLQANSQAAQMQNLHVTPKRPEAFTRQMQDMSKQIYPILEWHDDIMQSINEAIEQIPVLPDLIEQVQDQISIFVFSLLAPFVLPIIRQVKTELATGSSEVIASSREKQLIVFRDDRSTDPTHSMLSKDHFSNMLNEPAGKVASQVVKWVAPQLIACWDDERIDLPRTLNRIIAGVFHHPAMREYGDDGAVDCRRGMFTVIEQWWGAKMEDERAFLRDSLSREGVEQGRNHKEGVHDTGHGCGKPLGAKGMSGSSSSGGLAGIGALGGLAGILAGGTGAAALASGMESNSKSGLMGSSGGYGAGSSEAYSSSHTTGYAGAGAGAIMGAGLGAGSSQVAYGEQQQPPYGQQQQPIYGQQQQEQASSSSGGGMGKMAAAGLGGAGLGVLAGGLLGAAFSDDDDKYKKYDQKYEDDGSYTESYTEAGRRQDRYQGGQAEYGQAEYSQTTYPSGGGRETYQRYGQEGGSGYGYEQNTEVTPGYGGGYEETTTETRVESVGGEYAQETDRYTSTEASGYGDGNYQQEQSYERDDGRGEEQGSSSSDSDRGNGGGIGDAVEDFVEDVAEDVGGGW